MAEKTVPKESLTKEEEKIFQEIYPLAESYQAFLKGMLKGRLSQIERKEKPKQMIVRFLKSMPAIIGSDMKTYGPFKPEDIATLPPENAKILIKQGAAIELEANEYS
jgi:DNA replication factor GINS